MNPSYETAAAGAPPRTAAAHNPSLLVYHPDDRHMTAAEPCLRSMSAARLIHDMIVISDLSPHDDSGDISTRAISGGETAKASLDESLQGLVDSSLPFHVVAAAGCELTTVQQADLAAAADRISARCGSLLREGVTSIRLFFPGFAEPGSEQRRPKVSAAFFSPAAVNLAAVPIDAPDDRRMGRPIRAKDIEAFGWHVAVETASAAGAWRPGGGGLGVEPIPPGVVGDAVVRFVSSRVAAVRCSEEQQTQQPGKLPLPAHMATAPLTQSVSDMADALLPTAFTKHPQPRADDSSAERLTLGQAVRMLPLVLTRKRARREIAYMAEDAAAKLRIAANAESRPVSGLPEKMEGVERSMCARLASNVCGLADGGGVSDSGSARWMLGNAHLAIRDIGYFTAAAMLDEQIKACAAAASSTPPSSADPKQAQRGRP